MAKPCTESGCPRSSRARGLCQVHYSQRWKTEELPPLQRREQFVTNKLYLTKRQTEVVKRLAREENKKVSTYLRELVVGTLVAKKLFDPEADDDELEDLDA